MTAISLTEIQPGLVVHLDTGILRSLGGSETNAELSPGNDRAVVEPHYFLVLAVDAPLQTAIAVPLFSKATNGSERLDPAKKRGTFQFWSGAVSYFSKWQHWRIPLSALVAASGPEATQISDRCTYALGDSTTLDAIASWAQRNRTVYRGL